MFNLNRHKRKGIEGFKNFVMNLELFPSSTVREMIILGLLEDPVYLKYALKNRVTFNYLFELTQDDILLIISEFKNNLEVFAVALFGEEKEEFFITNFLPPPMQRQYREVSELQALDPDKKDRARVMIMKKVFELEAKGELPQFSWLVPPQDVLLGHSQKVTEEGELTQYYPDGTLALKGHVEKKLRVGDWEHFYPNGEIFAKGQYLSGEKTGSWRFFYPNGKLKSFGEYREDHKYGVWEEYKHDGSTLKIKYQDGQPIDLFKS